MPLLLVATVPLTGHVQPMTVLVRALVERGHEIHWYTGAKFAPAVRATGAAFVPVQHARDWDDADVDAAFPALRDKRGLSRVKTQLRELFIGPAADQLRDLEAITSRANPPATGGFGAGRRMEDQRLPQAGNLAAPRCE